MTVVSDVVQRHQPVKVKVLTFSGQKTSLSIKVTCNFAFCYIFDNSNTADSTASCISVRNVQNKPVGFYGPIVPPSLNAPSSECPPNVLPNSEFRTCPDPEFPNALHSGGRITLDRGVASILALWR